MYHTQKLSTYDSQTKGTQTCKKLQEEVCMVEKEEFDALNQQVRHLEARLQSVTEDKDLMSRELEENNYWIDNQHALHKANLELSNKVAALSKEKIELEDKVKLLFDKFTHLQRL